MQTVTVYNTDSIRARDILAKVSDDDVLTETMECVGRVYIEQCFFATKRRFDRGLFDIEMRIIGSVKELFIEDYDDRMFPCGTKEINFMDAEPVMINYQLTAEEMGILFTKGVNRPGFEPPANMKFNTMEIPMFVEYKGIYESPVCFTRIIRPNEIQTSTKKCGYYGLFELAAEHPEVTAEKANGGIDINLTKSSPELHMEAPVHKTLDQAAMSVSKDLNGKSSAEKKSDIGRSVETVREVIKSRMNTRPVMMQPSEDTVKRYHEAVADYNELTDVKTTTNVSDIGADGMPKNADNVVPYTVTRASDPNLYNILSQKAKAETSDAGNNEQFTNDEQNDALQERPDDIPRVQHDAESAEDRKLSKSEREVKRAREISRRIDVAEDNKALNEGNTDIAGHGASDAKKESAQNLLDGILPNKSGGGQQQFL